MKMLHYHISVWLHDLSGNIFYDILKVIFDQFQYLITM